MGKKRAFFSPNGSHVVFEIRVAAYFGHRGFGKITIQTESKG